MIRSRLIDAHAGSTASAVIVRRDENNNVRATILFGSTQKEENLPEIGCARSGNSIELRHLFEETSSSVLYSGAFEDVVSLEGRF